jgi:SAM-dependent methyltransferase
MTLFERCHQRFIADRRARILSSHLALAIPAGAQKVLDLGCGDGRIARLLQQRRPELDIRGIEVHGRKNAWPAAQRYDGRTLPFDAGEFDVVLLVDVLHHVDDPVAHLQEAARVTRHNIVIKDHLREGLMPETRLRFMDRVGNQRFGVPLPHHYWRRAQWYDSFAQLQIALEYWCESLQLYPWPLRPFFDGKLQFLARGRVPAAVAGTVETTAWETHLN